MTEFYVLIFFMIRSSNNRDKNHRPFLHKTQRFYRRHDEDFRQLPVLQPERVTVLQVRGVLRSLFREQNQIPAGEAIRD